MAEVEVDIHHTKLDNLLRDRAVAKLLLTTARKVERTAVRIAPKRKPRQMYASSIASDIDVGGVPVAYVSGDVDSLKIEYGTIDTPRFRPLGRAVEEVAARAV